MTPVICPEVPDPSCFKDGRPQSVSLELFYFNAVTNLSSVPVVFTSSFGSGGAAGSPPLFSKGNKELSTVPRRETDGRAVSVPRYVSSTTFIYVLIAFLPTSFSPFFENMIRVFHLKAGVHFFSDLFPLRSLSILDKFVHSLLFLASRRKVKVTAPSDGTSRASIPPSPHQPRKTQEDWTISSCWDKNPCLVFGRPL